MNKNTPKILRLVAYILTVQFQYRMNTYTDFPENLEFESKDKEVTKHLIMFNLTEDFDNYDNINYIIALPKGIKFKDLEEIKVKQLVDGVINMARGFLED